MRCLAQVSIDGMDALGGQELIINAHDSIDLERFILDGNMDSGRRFKFVPLFNSQVQDPSNPSNGDIAVTFTEEVEYYLNTTQDIQYYYPYIGANNGQSSDDFRSMSSRIMKKKRSSIPKAKENWASDNVTAQYASIANIMAPPAGDRGATVEGGRSGQHFVHGSFGDRGASYTVRIQLRAQKQAVYVTDTRRRFCPTCGKRHKYSANYCMKCGARI